MCTHTPTDTHLVRVVVEALSPKLLVPAARWLFFSADFFVFCAAARWLKGCVAWTASATRSWYQPPDGSGAPSNVPQAARWLRSGARGIASSNPTLCMNRGVHIYIHAKHTYIYAHTYTCRYVYTHIYVFSCIYTYLPTYIRTHTYIYTYTYIYVDIIHYTHHTHVTFGFQRSPAIAARHY